MTRGSFLLAAVGALPLVFVPNPSLGGETVFLLPKLMWLSVVIVPATLVLLAASRGASAQAGTRSIRHAIALPALLVGWMFAASFTHDDPWRSVAGRIERYDGALPHLGLLLCAAGGATLASLGRRRSLGSVLAWSGVAVAVVSVGQRLGVIPALASQRRSILLVDMPGSLIGNRGYTACFVAAMLPFAIERAQTNRTSRPIGWMIAIAGSGSAIGFGWTRGASVAALAALITYVVACREGRRRAAALAGIAALGLMLGTALAPSAAGGSAGHSFSAADSGRGVLYRAAFAGISGQPIVGHGAGGVLRVLTTTDPVTVLRWAKIDAASAERSAASTADILVIEGTRADGSAIRYENITSKTHNELLDYAVSYGIPAALLAGATMLLAIVRARRDAALVACLVGAAVGMLTWPQVMRTAPILWTVLGFALARRVATSPTTQEFVQHQLGDLVDGRKFVTGNVEDLRGEKGLDPLGSTLKTHDQRDGVAELGGEHDLEQVALPVQIRDGAEPRPDIEQPSERLLVGAAKRNGVAINEPRESIGTL